MASYGKDGEASDCALWRGWRGGEAGKAGKAGETRLASFAAYL